MISKEVLHTLQIMADQLDDPERRALSIMLFEGIFSSAGMISMGYDLIDLDGEDRKFLAVMIFQHLKSSEFEPGELRVRVGKLLAGISSSLPYQMELEARDIASELLGEADKKDRNVFGMLASSLPEEALELEARSWADPAIPAVVEYRDENGTWRRSKEPADQLDLIMRRGK